MVEGFACYAKKFGLSPVGNRNPRKVSRQGRDMLSVGENGLPQSHGLSGQTLSQRGPRGGGDTSFFLSPA